MLKFESIIINLNGELHLDNNIFCALLFDSLVDLEGSLDP